MSIIYSIAEAICFATNKLPGGGIKGSMDKSLTTSTGNERPPKWLSLCCEVSSFGFEGFPVYVLRSRKQGRAAAKALLFLAGGGGMSRPTPLHYDVAAYLANHANATVYLPFYPLAPAHNASEALAWLERLHGELARRHAPERIAFVGDSAGANLALALTGRLAQNQRPAGIVAISPAFGLEDGEPRDKRLQMESRDPILSVAMNDTIKKNWGRDVPLSSPDISPEYVDYAGFPPVLIIYGTHEIFYPLAQRCLNIMERAGVPLITLKEPLCHDWALVRAFPEARRALKQIRAFVQSL